MTTRTSLSTDPLGTLPWSRRPVGPLALWVPGGADQTGVGMADPPEPERTGDHRADTTWRSYVAELPAWAIVAGALAVSFWTQVFSVRAHRFADWESLVWSASTDFGTIAFLFLAREGAHRGTPTWGAWLGSVACAAMSVQFNVVQAIEAGDWLAVEAHLWMPALALGTWYWLLHGRHRRWVGWTGWRRAPAAVVDPQPVTQTGPASGPTPVNLPPAPVPMPKPATSRRDVQPAPEPAPAGSSDSRVDTLADELRAAAATGRPVSVKGLARKTGIPRTTLGRLLPLARQMADADTPPSTFRPASGGTGQEGVAA